MPSKFEKFHQWFWDGDIDKDPPFRDYDCLTVAMVEYIESLTTAELLALASGQPRDVDGVDYYRLAPLVSELAARLAVA